MDKLAAMLAERVTLLQLELRSPRGVKKTLKASSKAGV